MKKLPLLIVVLVALAAPAANGAEDPKQLFESATAEFNLGHYEKAAGMYEEIYKITLEPVLLYNIAQAHRLGGDFDKAVFFYRGYLRAQPQAKNRGEVQKRITELEDAIEAKRRGQVRPPNVPATVEPKAHPQTATAQPTPTPTQPPPPEPASQPMTTPSSEAQAAPSTEPQPQPTQTASNEPSSSEKPIWKKWWFWTIIGGVVVVGVVVAVAVVASQAPSFGANLPETGPGAHALTASSTSTPTAGTLRLVEVRF
ncbi:MAG: tetratricopeptide repeat protein [Polyangia bacterium]